MKTKRYGVYTVERNTTVSEEYDTHQGRFQKIHQVTKQPRMTYCDSAEEALEFIHEIKTRQHPNIVHWGYRGLMEYHA